MQNLIKNCLIFAAGLGVGGGIGWFVSARKQTAKMEAEIENRVEAELEYRLRAESSEEEQIDISEEDAPDEDESEEQVEKSYSDVVIQRAREKEEFLKNPLRTRYDKISLEDDDEDSFEPDASAIEHNNYDPDVSFEYMSPLDMVQNDVGYRNETLYWWEKDKILTDVHFDICDVPETIGPRWEEHIGEFEVDVVYVRNHAEHWDYDVIVKHASFRNSFEEDYDD